jgi:predicted GNAT family acetyltransferase
VTTLTVRECPLADFTAEAVPFLEVQEAEHNLILGVVGQLVRQESPTWNVMTEAPRLWLIEGSAGPVGAALLTPPDDLALSLSAKGAASALARSLRREERTVPGVTGPAEAADEFSATWMSLAETSAVRRPERIYKLTTVTPPVGVSGILRQATHEDLELLTEWFARFAEDADWELDGAFVARGALAERRVFLWLDGEPVSLAMWTRRTRLGCCIGAVYTPHEYRGHGYAEAVTAALSQLLLDSGLEFCCLYTDLENPVSNHLFEKIGYRPLIEVSHYSFMPPGS